jgi:hypothetical protein
MPQIPSVPATNEEHAVALELAASLGVTCQAAETYSVGVYRYTNLGDAVAQARRMVALECELLVPVKK